MTRYTLPESLGGGECTLLTPLGVLTGTGRPYVEVMVEGVPIQVPFNILTPVKPPPPLEPPIGSVVKANIGRGNELPVVFDRNSRGEWRSRHLAGAFTWADLCAWDTPVLLVPAAPPVEEIPLPYTERAGNRWAKVNRYGTEVNLVVGERDRAASRQIQLTPDAARKLARALETAAEIAAEGSDEH